MAVSCAPTAGSAQARCVIGPSVSCRVVDPAWYVPPKVRRERDRGRDARPIDPKEPTMYAFDARLSSAVRTTDERDDLAGPLSAESLDATDRYWRAANYLTIAQIYLRDNVLLREPL